MPLWILGIFRSKLALRIGAALIAALAIMTFATKRERHRQERITNKARKEAHDARNEIEDDIGRLGDDDVFERLRNKWKRD